METHDVVDEEITISRTRKTTMEDMEGVWSDPEQGEEEDEKKRQHTKENRLGELSQRNILLNLE